MRNNRALAAKKSNKFIIVAHLASVLCILYSSSLYAVNYDAIGATTEQLVQMRVGADFTKKWDCGVHLSIGEELRFNFMDNLAGTTAKNVSADTSYGASFYKSYTTLALAYAHPEFKYIKLDAGYTLRLFGNKGFSDPNEFLRHRVFFGVTGSYKPGQTVKLSLRERFVCDMRTDSVNLLEKNKYNWLVRSRLGAEFTVPGKPVKPYLWGELENTLNAPQNQQKDGRQFISHVRTQVGVKWRLTKLSSLDFYYRFQYGYDRDINITRNKGYIQLTEEKAFLHAIGVTYNLDW
ncbi:MAG: DUF2490 domain-containing protein [Paludibacteraceae bacterium]|nr:DUF2490 domain-containing protein [Paludibacteraceae bacterium]